MHATLARPDPVTIGRDLMKKFDKIRNLILFSAFMVFGTTAHAALELITNGEFSHPGFPAGTVNADPVTGWSSTGSFERWYQELFGSPKFGSDGLETGNHIEIDGAGNDILSTTFNTPGGLVGDVILTFDTWTRTGSGIKGNVKVTGSLSGVVLDADVLANSASWTPQLFNLALQPNESVLVEFDDLTSGSNFHIDQVSASAVPIPGAVWLLGSAIVGLIGVRRATPVQA